MINKDEVDKFSRSIEKTANTKSLSIIDSIIYHCQLIEMEVEVAAKLINKKLRKQLREEAKILRLIKIKE